MKPLLEYIKHPIYVVYALTRQLALFIPDKLYLTLLYRCKMGKWINWKNPQTFTEKIQWLKLYNRKPEYTIMVDKFAVKDYVASVIGSEYIIPTLGVWNTPEEIDFDVLPDKFVLKTTHGGSGEGIVICRDKATFNIESACRKLTISLKSDIYKYGREWPYKNVPRRIIAERLIEIPDKADLTDYKFFCFNGVPKYIQVIQDRNSKETIDFFDTDWNHQEFYGLNPIPKPANLPIPKPANFQEMLRVAEKLAKNTEFVRVDLYQTCDGVYFGELTFYPASGIGTFTPESWNNRLGDLLSLTPNEGGGKCLIYNNLKNVVELDNQLKDYKFFCFNGEPRFLKVDFDRFVDHHANYYDLDWNLLPFGEAELPPVESHVEHCPPNFDKMITIACKLSKGHSFLRVDLYNVAGRIFFGELTFYPASGLGAFSPCKYDFEIGKMFHLP